MANTAKLNSIGTIKNNAIQGLTASGLSPQAPSNPQQFDMNALLAAIQAQNQTYISSQGQQQAEMEARINALNQAKSAQAIADLGKARDQQLSNLVSEEAGINPMYNNRRNASAATNMMGRRTLAEELAARGEARSGIADEANIRANAALQGDLGALNTQEASDLADISRRKTGIQNAYESDLASAKAGLEAEKMQNLINQLNADRQFKLSEAGLTGTYNGNQTLDALNAARNFSLNEAGLTGKYNGASTLAAQNQLFNQDLATKQFKADVKQRELDNLYRDKAFNYQKSRDTVSDTQWQKSMSLDLRKQSFNEAQASIDNALSKQRISQEDASQALQWAKWNAEQDPNSLDNQYKKAQIDAITGKTNTGTTATVDDYAQTINSMFIVKPSATNNYQSSMDTAGIQAYLDKLISAGVDRAIINSLAARFGIQ